MHQQLAAARQRLAGVAKRVLPTEFVDWYRRRRATRRYLRTLGYEIYDRQVRMQLEDLEGRIAASRDGFYEQLVKDVVERSDLIIQELDRRIEGLAARHGKELRVLRRQVDALRTELGELREAIMGLREGAAPGRNERSDPARAASSASSRSNAPVAAID